MTHSATYTSLALELCRNCSTVFCLQPWPEYCGPRWKGRASSLGEREREDSLSFGGVAFAFSKYLAPIFIPGSDDYPTFHCSRICVFALI